MKPLHQLPTELKALNTAALLFAGIAILMAMSYIVASHMDSSSLVITPKNIARSYYGPGMSVNSLIGLAHIHMMGLLPFFWVIGYIFVHSDISVKWRVFLCILPFIAFPADVLGWFLTHLYQPFVYETIIGGMTFVLSLTTMILISLYQIWIVPRRLA